MSTDSDCLVYGPVKLIIKESDKLSLIDRDELINKLDFDHQMMIEFSVLCGTD